MRTAGLRTPVFSLIAGAMLVLLTAAPAAADVTGFIGRTTTPVGRPAKGFAVGTGLLIAAFEFEYSATDEDLTTPAGNANNPAGLKSLLFKLLPPTPDPVPPRP